MNKTITDSKAHLKLKLKNMLSQSVSQSTMLQPYMGWPGERRRYTDSDSGVGCSYLDLLLRPIRN